MSFIYFFQYFHCYVFLIFDKLPDSLVIHPFFLFLCSHFTRRFNATDFLVRLRGKKLMLVGDSMNRNQFESILCLLREGLPDKSRMREVHGHKITKGRGYYVFKFQVFGCFCFNISYCLITKSMHLFFPAFEYNLKKEYCILARFCLTDSFKHLFISVDNLRKWLDRGQSSLE